MWLQVFTPAKLNTSVLTTFFFKTSKPDFCLTEMKTCNLPGVFHLLLQNLSVKACVCSLIKCRWSSGCVLRAELPNCSPWSGFPSPWTLGGFLCLWAKSVNSVICVWPKRWVYMSAGHNEEKKGFISFTLWELLFSGLIMSINTLSTTVQTLLVSWT